MSFKTSVTSLHSRKLLAMLGCEASQRLLCSADILVRAIKITGWADLYLIGCEHVPLQVCFFGCLCFVPFWDPLFWIHTSIWTILLQCKWSSWFCFPHSLVCYERCGTRRAPRVTWHASRGLVGFIIILSCYISKLAKHTQNSCENALDSMSLLIRREAMTANLNVQDIIWIQLQEVIQMISISATKDWLDSMVDLWSWHCPIFRWLVLCCVSAERQCLFRAAAVLTTWLNRGIKSLALQFESPSLPGPIFSISSQEPETGWDWNKQVKEPLLEINQNHIK